MSYPHAETGGVKEGFTMARNRDYDDGDFDQPKRSSPYQDMDGDEYDDDYADDIMRAVFRYFHDTITGRPNMRRGEWRIDMLPTTCHIYFGEVAGASPSGRLSGEAVPGQG